MALSKAQIGSQGKIKPQLLSGKSNGKERLLPARGVEGVGLPARVVGEEALRWAIDTHLLVPGGFWAHLDELDSKVKQAGGWCVWEVVERSDYFW